jgi:hypothetical protein
VTGDRQYLDRSPCSVLAVCTCGWRELAFNDVTAWMLAVHHAQYVHSDAVRAIRCLSIARVRAERRRNNAEHLRATA